MSNPVFWKNKKNIINLPSAELAQRVIKVKLIIMMEQNKQTKKTQKTGEQDNKGLILREQGNICDFREQ